VTSKADAVGTGETAGPADAGGGGAATADGNGSEVAAKGAGAGSGLTTAGRASLATGVGGRARFDFFAGRRADGLPVTGARSTNAAVPPAVGRRVPVSGARFGEEPT